MFSRIKLFIKTRNPWILIPNAEQFYGFETMLMMTSRFNWNKAIVYCHYFASSFGGLFKLRLSKI